MFQERIICFGNGARLAGIMTEPQGGGQAIDPPAVLLWNAGLLHKVGPFRLFVDLARRLAALGFWVFRFDLSGKGDSETLREGALERERALADIRSAMDLLSKRKAVHRFVLIGSCSGADEAFPVAVTDPRVAGLVLFDGFGYRTLGYYLRHYGPRMFKLEVWQRFFRRNLGAVLRAVRGDRREEPEREPISLREWPPKEKVEEGLQELLARKIPLLFIYSGGVDQYYNYQNQFRHMFRSLDFRDRLQLEFFKEADHTYPEAGLRNKLIATVADWMVHHYKPTPYPRQGPVSGADLVRNAVQPN